MKKILFFLFFATLCHAQYGAFDISPDSTTRNIKPQQIQLANGDVVILWISYAWGTSEWIVYMRFWPQGADKPGKYLEYAR